MTNAVQESSKSTPVESRGALLALNHVTIRYEDQSACAAVSDVTFRLHAGETVLFLGPSGCGKSTIAMLCANLIPSAVEAVVEGEVWRDQALLKPGGIGYVFQDADVQFCMLHADDEIAFGLENRQTPREQMPEKIGAVLSQVRLFDEYHSIHDHFSGGMKQKLAIASAMALEPKVLILDEPTANLDPQSTGQVFRLVADLRKQGRTMVIIEHKFDALLPYTDRVVLMNRQGQIHRSGPTNEVIAQEWSWMVEEGVVPAWKDRPDWAVDCLLPAEGRMTPRAIPVVENTPTALEINKGMLRYGDRIVWKDVSVKIPQGAFAAVVGPNGAGKSSFLQVMAGLQSLTGGDAKLFGKSVAKWKTKDRMKAVSYCFQNPEYQFIFERVADELANRVVGEDIPPATLQRLAEFHLDGCAQQSPFGLSQGQKRRLSVASMLREDHDIYFFDEPTYGQDARTQQSIMECLATLHQRGKTIVMTTHDMDLVRRFTTHVLVLNDQSTAFYGRTPGLFEQPDVLLNAHLTDDVRPPATTASTENNLGADHRSTGDGHHRPKAAPITLLNPPIHLVTCLVAIFIAVFATNVKQAVAEFALPVVLMLVFAWMTPWQIIKRLSAFFIFYVLYVWSLTAYARVDAGTPTFDFLWIHVSYPGFLAGLVLAFRMLAAVCFGVLFVSNTDVTELVVGLSKNFRFSPKIAYGILAGIRFAPLFRTEWLKLRQARQLRGKDAGWSLLRPVTYALPLLSQAVRMSERVAIAMEARGFQGRPAQLASGRTFYRDVQVRVWDFLYGVLVILAAVTFLLIFL